MQKVNSIIKAISESPELKGLVLKVHNILNSAHFTTEEKEEFSLGEIASKLSEENIPKDLVASSETENIPLWAQPLEYQQQLLEKIIELPNIAYIFNKNDAEQTDLLTFIARSSHWDTVLKVWEACAQICKETKSPLTSEYFSILENTLNLYNLTLSNKKASLKTPQVDDPYDYTLHHQVAGNDKRISKVLLPALYTASDEVAKNVTYAVKSVDLNLGDFNQAA